LVGETSDSQAARNASCCDHDAISSSSARDTGTDPTSADQSEHGD
jgi:hypothetical protein